MRYFYLKNNLNKKISIDKIIYYEHEKNIYTSYYYGKIKIFKSRIFHADKNKAINICIGCYDMFIKLINISINKTEKIISFNFRYRKKYKILTNKIYIYFTEEGFVNFLKYIINKIKKISLNKIIKMNF